MTANTINIIIILLRNNKPNIELIAAVKAPITCIQCSDLLLKAGAAPTNNKPALIKNPQIPIASTIGITIKKAVIASIK